MPSLTIYLDKKFSLLKSTDALSGEIITFGGSLILILILSILIFYNCKHVFIHK